MMRIVYFVGHAVVVLILVVTLIAAAIQLAMPSFGQTSQCGPRDAVVGHLDGKYGETRRAIGLAANRLAMEVWANADTGSWTITVTTPQGMTCLVASGQDFQPVNDPAPVPGVPG